MHQEEWEAGQWAVWDPCKDQWHQGWAVEVWVTEQHQCLVVQDSLASEETLFVHNGVWLLMNKAVNLAPVDLQEV